MKTSTRSRLGGPWWRPRTKGDANHAAIVRALRQAGCSVADLRDAGQASPGCPDLLVGVRGEDYLLEVKTEKGRLRKSQRLFADLWLGRTPVVVRGPVDALEAVGVASSSRKPPPR